ncbi:MAG: zf-TFIIB domain-containing protein [Polyangiaceae bacterium]|nr:zf-TFIIB domain-containing protein [Polyangiaceae bacterium]
MPVRPTDKEQEYFARQEFERRKKAEQERQDALAQAERARLQKLHYMKCPKCGMDLVEIDYRGLKVDKCTGCEGVWLDPGELESVSAMDRPSLDRLFSVFRR